MTHCLPLERQQGLLGHSPPTPDAFGVARKDAQGVQEPWGSRVNTTMNEPEMAVIELEAGDFPVTSLPFVLVRAPYCLWGLCSNDRRQR
jgi:hypothetical protein